MGAREVRQRRWAPRLPLPDGKGRRASIQEQCSFAALSLYCARSANHGRCAPDERPTPPSGGQVSQRSWSGSTFEIAQKPAEGLLAPIAGLHGIPILGRLVPERPREVGCHALGRCRLAVILGAQRAVVCCEDGNVAPEQADRLGSRLRPAAARCSATPCTSSMMPRRRAFVRALALHTARPSVKAVLGEQSGRSVTAAVRWFRMGAPLTRVGGGMGASTREGMPLTGSRVLRPWVSAR